MRILEVGPSTYDDAAAARSSFIALKLQGGRRKRERVTPLFLKVSVFFFKEFPPEVPSKNFHPHLINQNVVPWKIYSVSAFSPKKAVFLIKEKGEKGYWFGS